jgi:hypothetical protein
MKRLSMLLAAGLVALVSWLRHHWHRANSRSNRCSGMPADANRNHVAASRRWSQ